MPSVTTKVKYDKKGLLQLRDRFKKLDDWSGQAGFWKEQKHPNGKLNAAELANILEYGANLSKATGKIPPRPFIHDGAEDSVLELKRLYQAQFNAFVEGKKSPRDVLRPIALSMAKWIQMRILYNDYVGNRPYTIEKKGFDHPLMETGWLADNVMTKTRLKKGDV